MLHPAVLNPANLSPSIWKPQKVAVGDPRGGGRSSHPIDALAEVCNGVDQFPIDFYSPSLKVLLSLAPCIPKSVTSRYIESR